MKEAFIRLHFDDREGWLKERASHLQASDAAPILGLSPWTTAAEVYDEKTGMAQPKDISDKPYVQYGIEMEPVAREAFLIDNPYFSLDYHPFDILCSTKNPWMGATLDGELTVTRPNPWGLPIGCKGIYEGKTGRWMKAEHLYGWDGTTTYIPQHYYPQGLHQLLCTGWDFVIFSARLKRDPYKAEDMGFPEIRTFYRIIDARKEAVQSDLRTLEEVEERFWKKNVVARKRPSRRIAI